MAKGMGTHFVTQIGILVHDIEKTRDAYCRIFDLDAPPIVQTGTLEEAETRYNGEETTARSKLCFFDFGQVQIELIEPDKEKSTWRECLDKDGEGVHHIAFNINGMKQVVNFLEKENMPLVQKGEYEGGRYGYIDSTDELKVMLELLENDGE